MAAPPVILRLRRVAQYFMAVIAVALATLVRWLLDPALGDHLPYVTYFVAVAFVAWRYDLGPSLLALMLGWWAAEFFFYSPRYVWSPLPSGNNPTQVVGAAAYFMVGLSSITVCEAMRRAQRQAERAQESLRVTFASIGDAVITTDAKGRVVLLNAMAETLTGWPQSEAAGRALREIFHIVNEQTRAPVENPADKVLTLGTLVGLANHTVLIARDGTERPIDDSAAPIRDAENNLIGVVLVFRNVTEQRRSENLLRESESRKTAILETALDCVITIDHEGKILEFNPACERTFGYSRAEAIGREMGELIVPPALRARHRSGLARYLATGKATVLNRRLELTAMRADGTEFPVELAITRIPVKGSPVFTGYIRDISERKRAEERQRFLSSEISHRSKNLLGVVQAIVLRSLSDERPLAEAREVIDQRIRALARSQLNLGAEGLEGASLTQIVRGEFEAFSDRVDTDGPDVALNSKAAQTFALVVHELATNATKHGSLSRPGGRVSVSWSIEGVGPQARLKFHWQERGGPAVVQPSRQGFGRVLLERAAAHDLEARTKISFAAEGLSYEVDAPLSNVSEGAESPAFPKTN